MRRNGKHGNIESAGKANKAGISRPLDYLCSEPLYYNLSTIHGTMICLTSYELSEALGFRYPGLSTRAWTADLNSNNFFEKVFFRIL